MTNSAILRKNPTAMAARPFVRWIRAVARRLKGHRVITGKSRIDTPSSIAKLPKVSSAAVILASLLVLAGWVFDIEFLKRVIPDAVAMNPMTAIAFILSSAGLWFSQSNVSDASRPANIRRAAFFFCAATAALIGLVILLGYVVGWDTGLDRLLFVSKLATSGGDPDIPNRMAPNTALNFLIAGTALLFAGSKDRRLEWLIQGMLFFVILTSFLAFLGHAYFALGLYRISPFIGMAVNTAACFMVLGLGILAARPDQGPMAIVARPHMGGTVARRLLPVAFLLPVTLGWVRLWGQYAGFYDTEFGLGLMVAASVILLTLFILRIANSLNRTDAERERSARTLRQKERLISAVGAMAKVGGWEFDPRTGQGNWTDEVARIHDMDPSAETDMSQGMSFYHGEHRAKIESAVRNAIERAAPYDLELEIITAGGNRKWVRTIGQPVVENGVVTRIWGSFQDISEHKRAEEEIRQLNIGLERKVAERTAELAAANKELEAFSYSVSHDLRAPLRSIDGFSQALLEDCAERLDEPGRQHLARVRAATVRMAELIDDLLQLSRVTRAEIHHETVNLSALAGSVMDELKRAEPQRHVEAAIQPELLAEGDAKLLRIALVNLFSNAWKFTGPEPEARIELGELDSGNGRAFFVRDNGVGFDMAYVGKLFGAFQRLHTPSEFPGTGIGLATVQRIVHRHGGRVWAEATVNQGATFYFTLPATRHA